jgi:hypothetical protein
MAKSNNKRRLYNTYDANVIGFANLMHLYLQESLAEFAAFDPQFTVEYLAELEADIEAASKCGSDLQSIGAQEQVSQDLKEKLAVCRVRFMDLKYFVGKAFEDDVTKAAEFVFKDYLKVRQSPAKMSQWLSDSHEVATKYASELTEAGFSSEKIAELLTLSNELKTLKSNLASAKAERLAATSERIRTHNKVFKTVQKICNVGKRIYANDYGEYEKFLYSW